jgi:carbonic anhydrase
MDCVTAGLRKIQTSGTNTTIGCIDISPVTKVFLDPSQNDFAYTGSLTQPPCTEGVTWIVTEKIFPMTVHQLNALKGVLKFNSRYTQNKLGDGNLVQIAAGNDTHPGETKEEVSQLK